MKIIGGGEYNLDSLKDIRVTNSFLNFDESIRDCQDNEPLQNCTTRMYMDAIIRKCKCLPLNLRIRNEVSRLKELLNLNKSAHILDACNPNL